jgi:putative transposase
MPMKPMVIEVATCIRTLRLKVRAETYPWLNAANATSAKAARPFAGPAKYLSGFDLDKLSAGASECFEHIGSETIQRVNAELATRRRQFKKTRLRWRVSRGAKRALGWVPFKAAQLKRRGKSLRFSGKAFRVFEQEQLAGAKWKCGCFAQDSVGDWWLCVPIERAVAPGLANDKDVGLDLGLKDTVATSDGERLEAGRFYRDIEQKIAQAQRSGHKRQAKRLHRAAARRRKDALHKFSTKIVDQYQRIFVGDVSSARLVKTRMAKSVLDAGWGMLKTQLLYKGQQAGRSVCIVNESYTTRVCSSCKAHTGPTGLDMLDVSQHGTTGSRVRSVVDYAADRERTLAQSHIRRGAGDEEPTIYWIGCPCGDDSSGDSRTRGRGSNVWDYPQSPRVGEAAHR